MKQKIKKWYVTFHTEQLFRRPYKKYYIAECDSECLAKNVASDLYSIDGIKYLHISTHPNKKGRIMIDMGLWRTEINEFINYKWLD